MEERGLAGLEARAADGSVLGRILDVLADEESGEVTHVVVESEEGEQFEVPITGVVLDPEADFAGFRADPSDDEPGDETGGERPEGYAPAESDGPDDHEGQFVTAPQDPEEAVDPEEAEREAGGWEDESSTAPDSGYPRNDVYIDPDTGEEEVDPRLKENDTLADDVEDLLADTGLGVRATRDGVVELTGSAARREDLDALMDEIAGLDGVLEVDTTDVDVG